MRMGIELAVVLYSYTGQAARVMVYGSYYVVYTAEFTAFHYESYDTFPLTSLVNLYIMVGSSSYSIIGEYRRPILRFYI